jgi:peptidoglycan/xylan/chitin deacetylase (PgdA/CDA1 family)
LTIESSVEERYRLIGPGKISSVCWGKRGDFFYIQGKTLYQVRGSELFTRAVYADFLEIGQALEDLPMEFAPDFDSFWMAPDSGSILLSKGGKNIFFYPLATQAPGDASGELFLPFLKLPAGVFDLKALWPLSGPLTVTASLQKKDGLSFLAWRLVADGPRSMAFVSLESPIGPQSALSPDGMKVLAWGDKGMAVLDYVDWKPLGPYLTGPVYSCVWINNSEYVYADNWWIESVSPARRRLICLAGVAEYGFEEGDRGMPSRVIAKSGGSWFVTDSLNPWVQIAEPRVRKPSQVSGRYRVYLENQAGFPYENIPMIRNTALIGTAALLPRPFFVEDRPARVVADKGAAGVFAHGLKAGPREVALCFDLYNDDTGLSPALEALNRFGLKATFFLNGDFIRRHPDAAVSIAESGHEAASMFYAAIDFSDTRYQINADYVARGLARNEDEYYRVTGSELALLWHPPFYRASAEIADAALRAGYLTIGRSVDPMDWISQDDALRLGIMRQPSPDLIERIMEEKGPGSIIPIRLGLQAGSGNDYLFLYIDLLLDALVRSGYSVVPVSTLVQRGL